MLDSVSSTLALVLNGGGFVVWPLAVMTVLLWYGLAARAFILRRGSSKDVETLWNEGATGSTLLAAAVAELRRPARAALREDLFEERLAPLRQVAGTHRVLIRGVVMVAPLLGLLGTVSGMIETFDSLADMALFTQSGGVAGGVSQALISTQVGLTVAIPGLVIGRLLDKKERALLDELDVLRDVAVTHGPRGGV